MLLNSGDILKPTRTIHILLILCGKLIIVSELKIVHVALFLVNDN